MDFRVECPHVASSIGSSQMVENPDLLFLRDDIADELGAVVGYLECAKQIKDHRISNRFREVANDETGHFILLMRMVSSLDPVQAEELKKHGLMMLNYYPEQVRPYGMPGNCLGSNQQEWPERYERHHRESSDKKSYYPDERDVECLRNAIRDELHAINAYQKQIQETSNQAIKNLLTTIMNKEKEHVSEFTKLFYDMYHED